MGQWVLKTRPGKDLENDQWPRFVAEGVVAIGWRDIELDPSKATKAEIAQAVARAYGEEKRAASKIQCFARDWKPGDLVLVTKGYPATSYSDVRFYGFARIDGGFFVDSGSDWWTFKYPAVLQVVDMSLPKAVYVETLRRRSLMETLHRLGEDEVKRFCNRLEQDWGITLKV